MIIPEVGKKINYRYFSSLVSMNIVMTVGKEKHGCKSVTIEGPFIGKYFAIIHEDNSEILLLAFGKGLYYGDITREVFNKPLFRFDKSGRNDTDIPIGDKYILNQMKETQTIRIGNREYKDCMVMNLVYEKGKYVIYLKEGIGLILIQNMVNNIIKDEIKIQEA